MQIEYAGGHRLRQRADGPDACLGEPDTRQVLRGNGARRREQQPQVRVGYRRLGPELVHQPADHRARRAHRDLLTEYGAHGELETVSAARHPEPGHPAYQW